MTGNFRAARGSIGFVKGLALVLGCVVACGGAPARAPVTLVAPVGPPIAPVATSSPSTPRAAIVVTGAPFGALALWRAFATGRIEPVAFPWAKLTIIDSLVVSPDGRDVAYVEGGSAFGPLLVRSLADGATTRVAAHVSGGELLVVAWSPDGRKLLYRARRAGQLRPDCHFSGCPAPGPSSYFVFDRDHRTSVAIDAPGELAAWLPSGEMVVVDDDGALTRITGATKQPIPLAYRHDDFALDAASKRLLMTGWDERSKSDVVLALDLTTWKEAPVSRPAPYATYHWPSASPAGRHVAWLATSFAHHSLAESLVADEKTIAAPTADLVGFTWIDEETLAAHYADRIDVLDAKNGAVEGSQATNAHDSMR